MSNVDQARAAYEAFSGGDLQTLRGMFEDDAVWVSSDELPEGGEISGADEVVASFGRIPENWSSFSVEPEEFIDGGDWVTVRGTQRASNDNGSFESRFAHLIQFRGDRISRGEFFTDSAKAAKLL